MSSEYCSVESPVTKDDLVWKFGETTADNIQQIKEQLTVHARGFVVGTDVWFDEYAVMMGHKYAWEQIIQQYYDGLNWVDVSDNGLYFSIVGSGSFVLQHPIGYNITQKHLETLYALCELMEFDADYTLTIRHEEYDPYLDGGKTTKITVSELETYINGETDLLDDIIGEKDEEHGIPYEERLEQVSKNREEYNGETSDEDSGGDTESDESSSNSESSSDIGFTWTKIVDSWCEKDPDTGLYNIIIELENEKDHFDIGTIKLAEFPTKRQAEQASESMTGFHLKQNEIVQIQRYNDIDIDVDEEEL